MDNKQKSTDYTKDTVLILTKTVEFCVIRT